MIRLHFLDIVSTRQQHQQQQNTDDGMNDDVGTGSAVQPLVEQYPHLLSEDFCRSMAAMGTMPFETAFKPLMQAAIRLIAGEIVIREAEELYDALRPLVEQQQASKDESNGEGIVESGAQTVEQLARHVKHAIWFVQNSIRNNINVQQLMEDMETLGWTDEARRVFAARLWRRHYVAMSRSMLQDTLQVRPLKDMDWRFGVVASSSELSQVGRTFLQMKIRLLESVEDDTLRDVFLELSLPQFYEFLHEMEKAYKSLEFFASA